MTILHGSSMFWRNIGDRRVLDDPSVQERHYVEWCANNAAILAEAVRLRYRHIGILESMYYPIFSLNLVSRGRQQLSWRLLSHNIFGARLVRQLIGGVRLSISKLCPYLSACFNGTLLQRKPRREKVWYIARIPRPPGRTSSQLLLCFSKRTCFTSTGTLISGTFCWM